MTDPVVKTSVPKKTPEPPPPGHSRPGRKANIEVRLVQKERVRRDRDRPTHMADIKIPGPGSG